MEGNPLDENGGFMEKIKVIIVISMLCSVLASCTVMAQGNYINAQDLEKVKEGDSFQEVKGKIGYPQWVLPWSMAEKIIPQDPKYLLAKGRKDVWFYQNENQFPLVIIHRTGVESKTDIDEDGNIAYYPGPRPFISMGPDDPIAIEMDQVINMQKFIQKSKEKSPVHDYLIIFINGKVAGKEKRIYK